MANINDYIEWRGDLSFDDSEFNDVDNLIFAQMTMMDLKGIVPPPFESGKISLADAAELYFSDEKKCDCPLGILIPPETVELFRRAAASRRFGAVKLSGYVTYTNVEEETQFAALTYEVGDGSVYVSFRGTDDTIVGWKEDFNLSFLSPIPAQTEAKKYIDQVGAEHDGAIRTGGHSKGGNLAVYAAVKASEEVKNRIVAVYNNDGPGFDREFLASEDYEDIAMRINTIVPQSSVVGMFFENKGDYHVVQSNMTGLLQHNPFSWELVGKEFIYLDSLTEDGKRISKALNDWIARMDTDERKKFVDAVYSVLIATEATTLTELYADKYAIVRAFKDSDKETRNMIINIFGLLAEEGGKLFKNNLFNLFAKRAKSENDGELDEREKERLETALSDAKSALRELEDGELPPLIKEEPAEEKKPEGPKPIPKKRAVKKCRPKPKNDLITRLAVKARYAVVNKNK